MDAMIGKNWQSQLCSHAKEKERKMTANEKRILNLWVQFKANPDSPQAAAILKMIVSIDRKGG